MGALAAVGVLTAVGGVAHFTCNFSILGALAAGGNCCAFLGGGTCCAPYEVDEKTPIKYLKKNFLLDKDL